MSITINHQTNDISATGGKPTVNGAGVPNYYEQEAEPSNPSSGDIWLNPATSVMSFYADGVWGTLGYTPPPPPVWYGELGTFGGGYGTSFLTSVEYITIATTGNATSFGNLSLARGQLAACSDGTYGVFGGGWNSGEGGGTYNTIDYITFSSPGTASSFGTLTSARRSLTSVSNGFRGVFAGGYNSLPAATNTIDYITVATVGNAASLGNLSATRYGQMSCANLTYGVFAGGSNYGGSEYIAIDVGGTATNFGALMGDSFFSTAACSSSEGRGILFNGRFNNFSQYITIDTPGAASFFGTIGSQARNSSASCSDGSRGILAGGYNGTNTIDYITISTLGNTTDFGDLIVARGEHASAAGT